MIRVLFVCMGNICRSPTAHGVFQHLVRQHDLEANIEIDSAGTHAYHVGESPDSRSTKVAESRGYDLSYIRARRVEMSDFEYFDYILAMDADNYEILCSMAPSQYKKRVSLFLDFANDRSETEVPDPYFGGGRGFDHVLDLVESASNGLLAHIRSKDL